MLMITNEISTIKRQMDHEEINNVSRVYVCAYACYVVCNDQA